MGFAGLFAQARTWRGYASGDGLLRTMGKIEGDGAVYLSSESVSKLSAMLPEKARSDNRKRLNPATREYP